MELKFTLFGNTNVGSVRDHNEDNFVLCSNLSEKQWSFSKDEQIVLSDKGAVMVVADGMGGTNAGEVASDIAQRSVKNGFDALETVPGSAKEREQWLKQLVVQAHKDVVSHQEENLETAGMGTTLVIAWVIDHTVHVAWSGDSRCYVYDPDQPLYPFSEDHSIVWDLVKQGDLTPEEARTHPNSNIISQSLGDPKNAPKPGIKTRALYKGNKILVCSDGLNGMLSDEEMQAYLQKDQPVSVTCKELVDAANAAGGHDNITCLLMEVLEGNPAPAELPKDTGSSPTPTAVLRKKVKINYAVIGVLLVVVAGLLYLLFGRSADATGDITELAVAALELDSSRTYEISLEKLLGQKAPNVEKIEWNGPYELKKDQLTLAAPISLTDTLRVWFEKDGTRFLGKTVFTHKEQAPTEEAVETEEFQVPTGGGEENTDPRPNNTTQPSPPSQRPETGESNPPANAPQAEPKPTPPANNTPPALTPITPKDTSKK